MNFVVGNLRSRFSNRKVAYLLAITLPWVSSFLNRHISGLQLIPFALYFLTIVLCSTLGGIIPSLLALTFSIVSRQVFPMPGAPLFPVARLDVFRYAFLLASAVLISLIGNNLRRARLKLEAALTDLQDRNEALVESLKVSKCASWTYDFASGHNAHWYAGSYPVFGRPFQELEELLSVAPLLQPEDQVRFEAMIERMRTSSSPVIFEYQVTWPNREAHWLEMRANRIPGGGNRWRGVTVDVTERKLTEAALLRSEKLAAMGRLASTVAHEINNPLEAVTNLLYLAGSSAEVQEPSQSYISMAERELSRLSNITRLTLGFVRSSAEITDVDVAQVVDDVLSIFQHRLENKSVQVVRQYEPDIKIAIAPHELRQVVTNLVANAADALSANNPILTITTSREETNAVLLVEDNGCGIPEQNMPRIFEPFFTTKAEVGTGIGLWVTREIVDRHTGTVTAESGDLAPHVVTRFRVELPLAKQGTTSLHEANL